MGQDGLQEEKEEKLSRMKLSTIEKAGPTNKQMNKTKQNNNNKRNQQLRQHICGQANMLISKTALNNVIHVVGKRSQILLHRLPIQFCSGISIHI